jgi:spore coat polysaccharide biosynthesis protein SpsF
MKTATCIVQARLGSTRLPAKVLLPLPNGRTVLEEVVWRCKHIRGVDLVICAVPDTPESDPLKRILLRPDNAVGLGEYGLCHTVTATAGPESDVLARYADAAEFCGAEYILRVTSDCPLLSPAQCELVLDKVLSGEHDFAANSGPGSYSLGWSCEAFTADLLRQAGEHATDPSDREHVGPWPRRNARNPAHIVVPEAGSALRPSIDTLADYVATWGIFQDQMREAA